MCKWTICASAWKKKNHQHKLQLVTTKTGASGMFAPVERKATPQAQGAKVGTQGWKVRASISTSQYGMQQQHATTNTTTTDQIRAAQHDAAINATCVMGHHFPYKSSLRKFHWLLQHTSSSFETVVVEIINDHDILWCTIQRSVHFRHTHSYASMHTQTPTPTHTLLCTHIHE